MNSPPRSAPSLLHSRELAFRDLIDLFSRALLIIRARWLSGLAAAAILGGLAGHFLLQRPVEYTARTILFAQGTLDKVIGEQSNASNDALGLQLENTLRNHLSIMEGRSFRSRLIASLSPSERAAVAGPYLVPGRSANDDFLDALLESKITVERERGREFFTIDVKHRNPATALMLANRFDSEYLALVQNQFRDANKEGFAMLEKQAATLRKEIAQAADERLEYRKQNQIMSLTDNQGILAERLKRIDAASTDAHIQRIRLETELAQVHASMAHAEFPWDNDYLATYGNNAFLHQDLDRTLDQKAVLATRYGPAHPKMRDIDAAIAGIRANIRHNFQVAVQDLEIQLKAVRRTEADLKAEFDAVFAKSVETEKLASRSDIFATDIEVKRQNLVQLEKKIGEAGLYSQLPVDFMQISDPPYIVRPMVSMRTIQIALAAFIACGIFLITPLGIDVLDRRLKSTGDPEAMLQLRLLGAIPVLKMRKKLRAHVVRDGRDPANADAFGDVIGEIDLISAHPFPKILMVSSTLPGEGKSIMVSNLAAGYAVRDRRVVILDLDLRRPSQQRLQGVKGHGGFLIWARAGFRMENLLESGGALGLRELQNGIHLIPAGGEERGSNHHLGAPQMTQLLHELQRRFDVVLIDTPPAGLFQDALLLARFAQERLLVARVAKAPVSQICKVIADFEKVHAPLTGVIVNGFQPRVAHQKLAYVYRAGRAGYYTRGHAAAAAGTVPNPIREGGSGRVHSPAAGQPAA